MDGNEKKDTGIRQAAEEKLRKELDKASDKQFAKMVIGHMLKRIEEDEGLAEDVMKDSKTWSKCIGYIFDKAKKLAKGARSAAVQDATVYEWAEDYYRKDDAKEEAEKKKEAEKKQKAPKAEKKTAVKPDPKKEEEKKPEQPAAAPETVPKPKNEIEGQMDLFSMFG